MSTAESLTGGLLAASLTAVPGASASYLGGVVAYATEVKVAVLGVPASVVERHGVVSAECVRAMAGGVRDLIGATYGVATSGVAGPTVQEDKAVGTVYVGLCGPSGTTHLALRLTGDRRSIVAETVDRAWDALLTQVRIDHSDGRPDRGTP